MTASFDEVRAALALVAELLDTAGQYTGRAATMIDDALAELSRLSEQHSESLVPPELRRAADGAHRGVLLIQGGAQALADIDARL